MNIDVLGDYEVRNHKVGTSMRGSRTEIVRLRTHSGFMMTYQAMADRDQEHMMFLLFWLNKFIFPYVDGGVKPE